MYIYYGKELCVITLCLGGLLCPAFLFTVRWNETLSTE